MKLELLTPSTALPVTIDEAKAHMRIIGDEEDALIESYLLSALTAAEEITNLQLGGVATFVGYLDRWESFITFPKSPLRSVQKVEYLDKAGEWREFETKFYYVDTKATPATLKFLKKEELNEEPNSLKITFECGFEVIPHQAKQFILTRAATHYEHREEVVVGASVTAFESPFVKHLLDSLRVIPL